jgi:hypothetical protein
MAEDFDERLELPAGDPGTVDAHDRRPASGDPPGHHRPAADLRRDPLHDPSLPGIRNDDHCAIDRRGR